MKLNVALMISKLSVALTISIDHCKFQDPKRRGTASHTAPLVRRFLKPKAFPSIFPGLATHYQKEVPAQRTDETSSSARRARLAERQEAAAEEFLAADKVNKIKITF